MQHDYYVAYTGLYYFCRMVRVYKKRAQTDCSEMDQSHYRALQVTARFATLTVLPLNISPPVIVISHLV